jgi:ankyrin repeat protein
LKTPLHYACINGHEVAASILLKNKAQIQAKDNK